MSAGKSVRWSNENELYMREMHHMSYTLQVKLNSQTFFLQIADEMNPKANKMTEASCTSLVGLPMVGIFVLTPTYIWVLKKYVIGAPLRKTLIPWDLQNISAFSNSPYHELNMLVIGNVSSIINFL